VKNGAVPTPEEDAGSANPTPTPLDLSLVIPAYNEAERLEAGFERLRKAMESGALDPQLTQFVIVDDGSADATSDCAKSVYGALPNFSVVKLPENRGKGAAVRAGVAESKGRAIAFADADMAIDPIQIPKFLAALDHSQMAIGSRAASGASVDRPNIRRSAMNRMFNHFVNATTHLGLDDTQCGFKAFRGPVARLLFHMSGTDRMAFDVEILSLARNFGLSIEQVPVHWSRVAGSRVRSWSDTGSMVRDVLRAGKNSSDMSPIGASRIAVSDGSHSPQRYLRALATSFPVVELKGDEFLVLYPLLDQDQTSAQAAVVARGCEGATVTVEQVTTAQLRKLAPLSLLWDDLAP
jgi:dolichyl-phosphate beta-glucosyltransferase